MKSVSVEQHEQLVESTTKALGVHAGLLAEAVGSLPLAHHFGAALKAERKMRPDALRDRLLRDAYRIVLIKARNRHPDDSVLQDLCASELPDQTKQ